MELKIEEFGLENMLDIVKSDLGLASESKKTNDKNYYISKAYGEVIAICELIRVEKVTNNAN